MFGVYVCLLERVGWIEYSLLEVVYRCLLLLLQRIVQSIRVL